MKLIRYIQENGIYHTLKVVYAYKIDIVIQKIMEPFLKNKTLKDIIVIESHDDFDNNGGAFYNYLINEGYNKKYKIVWLIKHPEAVPKSLPSNVEWVSEYKPGLKKNYYKWIAKWFTADQDCSKKKRADQISCYFTHGPIGLKDCTGLISLPDNLNYCLTASEYYAPFSAKTYQWEYPDQRLQVCGFPAHDFLYNDQPGDLSKVLIKNNKKVILWMPTFRKSIGKRNDSTQEQKLGIPLIDTLEEYQRINEYLAERSVVLILKLHPKQDITTLKVSNMSNIIVLTGIMVKRMGIDTYRLMKDVDAMISDYSSTAYDFLHVNKPIAYDFSDIDNYTRGIIVEDPHEMMAGYELKHFDDLLKFIDDISSGIDLFRKQRKELFDRLFKYHDGDSSKRIVELLGL